MQQSLTAGDTLNFATTTPGYSAADGWALSFRLVPRSSSGTAIELNTTAEGEAHRCQAGPSTTELWLPDAYTWTSWVTRSTESYTINSGQITIKPNPRTVAAGYDGRSQMRRALDDSRTALAAYNPTQKSYKIADRERVFNSAADIIKLITYLEQQVAKEDALSGNTSGPALSRRIYSRL